MWQVVCVTVVVVEGWAVLQVAAGDFESRNPELAFVA